MPLRFFTIPIGDDGTAANELNRFLSTHRVTAFEKHLIPDGANSVWAICVTYPVEDARPQTFRRNKVDYQAVLDEKDFAVFVKLRDLRRTLSEANGVPPFVLFTDEQLADMIRRRVRTGDALSQIRGVGKTKVEKYGTAFLGILTASLPDDSEAQTEPESKKQGSLPLP